MLTLKYPKQVLFHFEHKIIVVEVSWRQRLRDFRAVNDVQRHVYYYWHLYWVGYRLGRSRDRSGTTIVWTGHCLWSTTSWTCQQTREYSVAVCHWTTGGRTAFTGRLSALFRLLAPRKPKRPRTHFNVFASRNVHETLSFSKDWRWVVHIHMWTPNISKTHAST